VNRGKRNKRIAVRIAASLALLNSSASANSDCAHSAGARSAATEE